MWYVSKSVSYNIKSLSRDLLFEYGAKQEFNVAIKVLSQLMSVLCDYNINEKKDYRIGKEIFDALFVLQHPINVADVKPSELRKVGLGKIARTRGLEFGTADYKPVADFQSELDSMAKATLAKNGDKFQISITVEELSELIQQLSKYNRNKPDRVHMIEELYDVIYTLRYPMFVCGITGGRLNDIAKFRLLEIRAQNLTYKGR